MQASHQKGKHLHHEHLTGAKNYLTTNELNNKKVSLLINLRCQSVSGVKDNFHQQFRNNLMCELCGKYLDNQVHLLKCQAIRKHIEWDHENIKLDHIYGSLQQQIEITMLIFRFLEVRDRLLENAARACKYRTAPDTMNICT